MRRTVFGILLLAAGAVVAGFSIVEQLCASWWPTEKDAIFFLGHWWDGFWEVRLPCLGLGIVLCSVGGLVLRSVVRKRMEAPPQS